MNRRCFLKSTVAFAAATPFSGALPAADSAKPARPRIKIGFLGVAHSHALAKVKVVQESPDYDLAGICEDSETPDSTQPLKPGEKAGSATSTSSGQR
jgi:hypothetical protein